MSYYSSYPDPDVNPNPRNEYFGLDDVAFNKSYSENKQLEKFNKQSASASASASACKDKKNKKTPAICVCIIQ